MSAWLTPPTRWDLTRTALMGAGLLLIVVSFMSTGAWLRGPAALPVDALTFGTTAVLVLVAAQGASLAYTTGRWGALGGWIGGGLALVAAVLVVLNLAATHLPVAVSLPVPRVVILVAGILLGVVGSSRNSDAIHEREDTDGNWFVTTGRVLRATQFWTDEQAQEQMRRARAEFDHAQARRAHGSAPLTPRVLFGTPEEYAASLTSRPEPSTDPIRAGRWYYLLTALVLGVWALWRTTSVGMNGLTAVLFLFAVVAVAMFVWASLRSRRR